MNMNIYAKPGDKVMVTEESSRHGYDHNKAAVKERLSLNTVYIVEEMEVHNFSSSVKLQGIDWWFNTVNFEDA